MPTKILAAELLWRGVNVFVISLLNLAKGVAEIVCAVEERYCHKSEANQCRRVPAEMKYGVHSLMECLGNLLVALSYVSSQEMM